MIEPIKSGSFTYTHPGGLLNSSVPRADKKTLNHYLNPVRPPRKQTWVPPKLTGKWCKAQLAHYGIKPLSGSKQELEARLRVAWVEGLLKKQPLEMKLLEKYMRAEWRGKREGGATAAGGGEKKRGGGRGRGGGGGGGGKGKCFKLDVASDDEEVVVFPQRVFKEEDGDGGGGIKEEEGGDGIFAGITAASKTSPSSSSPSSSSPPSSSSSAPVPPPATAPQQKTPLQKSGSSAFTKKHIFGTWDATCPAITQTWETEELTFTLMQDTDPSHPNTIVGEVDFGVMDGVLRLKSYPSAKNHTVGFYWAGRSGEDGEVQLSAREGEITFFDRGLKAKGIFEYLEGVGRGVRFEARKIAQGPVAGMVDWGVYGVEEGGGGGGGRGGGGGGGGWEGDFM
ncbi:hypothetical protein L873DRAFT_1841412 [Choiromyces venosus 120613-1]|uniref:Uncharacterized protein n=1 Tax=Choiromyces venosus 120613-1 TaxID=1336337 RepID=A0A3N4JXZ0_9PEZI|nr:hypothetical protein L873DRAFT_1841412 [Choiromyces venosus 120613-1]